MHATYWKKCFLLLKVAGISFAFDPVKPSGERVTPGSVMVGREPLVLNNTYRLCTKDYLAKGKDGYDCFVGSQVIVNDEDGPQLSTIIQNHFQSVNYLTGLCKFKYYHHQSIISRCERKTLSRQVTIVEDEEDGSSNDQEMQSAKDHKSGSRRLWKKAGIALSFARHCTIQEAETKEIEVALAPKVQQRIKILGDGSL